MPSSSYLPGHTSSVLVTSTFDIGIFLLGELRFFVLAV